MFFPHYVKNQPALHMKKKTPTTGNGCDGLANRMDGMGVRPREGLPEAWLRLDDSPTGSVRYSPIQLSVLAVIGIVKNYG